MIGLIMPGQQISPNHGLKHHHLFPVMLQSHCVLAGALCSASSELEIEFDNTVPVWKSVSHVTEGKESSRELAFHPRNHMSLLLTADWLEPTT